MQSNHLFILLKLLERPLNQIHQPPQRPKNIPQTKRPPLDTNGINKEINKEPINNDESEEDTERPPLIAIMHIKRLHVLAPIRELTVLTMLSGGWIEEVADSGDVVDPIPGVFFAGLARGWIEEGCFGGGAVDFYRGKDGGDDSS